MNYNIQDLANPASTFASRFTLPLWNYVVPQRKPEDPLYIADIDFRTIDYAEFLQNNPVLAKDILEVFCLRRRVMVTGVQVEIINPAADLFITPVTNSGIPFDTIDCGQPSKFTYVPNYGVLDRNTPVVGHAIVIDDPDYLGFRIESGVAGLENLAMQVQLIVSDRFDWTMATNSAKVDGVKI